MRLLVELSGEQPDLARAEALAAIEALGAGHRVVLVEERLLAVETDADPGALAARLGLANVVDELLAHGSLEDVLSAAQALDLGGRTFRVRVNSLRGCHEKTAIEKQVGDLVRGPVDLAGAEEEVRLIEGERHYLGRRLATVDRRAFERRKVGERAFVQPISLHPRLARVVVNLARTREGGRFLDPFCGTGGVMIEAGLLGARLIGGDVRADMVEGCRRALQEFGLAAELHVCDVGDLTVKVGRVDAIAMDPPYGRATTTKGEPLASLYARAMEAASHVLRPGGYLAIIVPDPQLAVPPEGLELVEAHALRVHRSLTRHFVVIRRAS